MLWPTPPPLLKDKVFILSIFLSIFHNSQESKHDAFSEKNASWFPKIYFYLNIWRRWLYGSKIENPWKFCQLLLKNWSYNKCIKVLTCTCLGLHKSIKSISYQCVAKLEIRLSLKIEVTFHNHLGSMYINPYSNEKWQDWAVFEVSQHLGLCIHLTNSLILLCNSRNIYF